MSVENSTWLKYRPNQIMLTILKVSVGILLIWFLASKIVTAIQTDTFLNVSLSSQALIWFFVSALLTYINWFLEAKKWQILSSPYQTFTITTAYKSVLAGLATGLLTPNRIGNFIGRLAYVHDDHKIQAGVNTQVGNLAQFIISILFGIAGLVIVINYLTPAIDPITFFVFPLLLLIASVWIFFNPKVILILPFGRKIYKHRKKEVNDLAAFQTDLKLKILFFSGLRYLVFLVQYYCLFRFFGIEINPLLIAGLSATTFLVTTVIPGVFFGKLIVRESAAVFVFTWIALPISTILAVSFLLWLINLAIPALFGWYFWIKKPAR